MEILKCGYVEPIKRYKHKCNNCGCEFLFTIPETDITYVELEKSSKLLFEEEEEKENET